MARSAAAAAAKAILKTVTPKERVLTDEDFLSTGLTVVDLACHGRTSGGIAKGFIVRLCGRTSSGKTFIGRTILAMAANNPRFDDYELIYDDVERGALMGTAKFFGQRLVDRLSSPAITAKTHQPIYSETPGGFFKYMNARLDAKRRFVWILDSTDALKPDKATKMGDGKAKQFNNGFRDVIDKMHDQGSIIVLVSQARPDMKSLFGGETTSGGKALEFYPSLEIWLREVKKIRATHNGREYPVGSVISARIKKNRISGNNWTVYFPFRPDYGLDDIGANIDFLRGNKHWPQEKGIIDAKEFSFSGPKLDLIHHIENESLQRETQVIVAKVWKEIEVALKEERKPRFE